jgi:hypothetical protein
MSVCVYTRDDVATLRCRGAFTNVWTAREAAWATGRSGHTRGNVVRRSSRVYQMCVCVVVGEVLYVALNVG